MRALWLMLGLAAAAVAQVDPKMVSVHPFSGQRGEEFTATVRGNGLAGATSVYADKAPLVITIEGAEAEPPKESDPKSKTPFELVRLRVQVAADARPGRYSFRIVTPHGVSNALPLYITEYPVAREPEGPHGTPETAVPVSDRPLVYTGRLSERGESDYYAFEARAGEKVTFEAISGLPSLGGPGGNANGFDPSLTILEPSGSWFDSKRVNRIAFNDEPLWVTGRLTDSYLVHKFTHAGRYLLRIEGFSGQGGPDYSYQLKILAGAIPFDAAAEDRAFSRHLSADRPNELAARGGKPRDRKSVETYRAAAVPAEEAPQFKLPGTLEGDLTRPGETYRARFHLDGPQDIAIEVETPLSAPPIFNPVVRLLDAGAKEVATNIFASLGACSGDMTKSIQAKTLVPLRDPGDYTIEIRDVTSDVAEPGFRYRVQVRSQVAHIGQVKIEDDHVNLAPAEVKTVRVLFDREEDYRGAVAVAAELLPAGVHALAGADFEPDKDAPQFVNKRERYTPRTERTVVVFTASADAVPMKQPQMARLVVRPVVDGKLGEVVMTKQIPVMVIAKP